MLDRDTNELLEEKHPDVGQAWWLDRHEPSPSPLALTAVLRDVVAAGAGWLEMLLERVALVRDAAQTAARDPSRDGARGALRSRLARTRDVAVAWTVDLLRRDFGGEFSGFMTASHLVQRERERQSARWGDPPHPDVGEGWWLEMPQRSRSPLAPTDVLRGRVAYGAATERGPGWLEILMEEVGEARDVAVAGPELDSGTRDALRVELVQVAAVAVAWLEDLDRREAREEAPR